MPKTARSRLKLLADPWTRMDALVAGAGLVGDEIPEGAFTAQEFAIHYRLAPSTARSHLGLLVKAGKINCGRRVLGRAWTTYYWPA